MNVGAILSVVVLNLIGAASPGPDVLLVTRLATKSRRHALTAVFALHLGVIMWVSLTVFGAAALLTRYPALVGLIELCGGLFLFLMGRAMTSGGLRARRLPVHDEFAATQALGSPWRSARLALATNLSNPKIVLFLAAIVAPAMPAHPSVAEALVMIAALCGTSLIYFICMALIISTKAVRRRLLRAGPWIDIVSGSIFMIFGSVLLVRGAMTVL